MNYEQKYKEALEKLQEALAPCEDGCKISGLTRGCLENIFPELKESEGERIRKWLIDWVNAVNWSNQFSVTQEQVLAWLVKQGQEPKKVSIWKHWENGIAGNGSGEQKYLIKTGNTYNLSSCLGFECDYIELSELDNLMLEKQGEKMVNADEVIAWLVANIRDYEYFVEWFKKEFGL